MTTLTLPKRFVRDWLDCIAPEYENEVSVVKEDYRSITIEATDAAVQDLANRADYVIFSRREMDAEYFGLVMSAKALLKHLAKIGVKPYWPTSAPSQQ